MKKLKTLPNIPGITEETRKNLRWKSLKYMVAHDEGRRILRHFLKHPLRYSLRYLRSVFKKKSYRREGDFFLYGLSSADALIKRFHTKDTLLVVGFSYCQKPHECPSGRFNDLCVRDPGNAICNQCDIFQAMKALPKDKVVPLLIPTIHYIGDKIFELVEKHPKKEILFLITACELTLEMFGDYGHMAGIRGIGVRLDGRICNTFKAFELSEVGIKPGLTVVTPQTQQGILSLLHRLAAGASV